MTEPNVPPPSKAPAKAAKGLVGSLKGHPPWLYAVVIAGAIAAAYYIRQRQIANSVVLSGADDTSTPVDGYASANYDTSAYPGATQGASYWGSYQPGDEVKASDTSVVDQLGTWWGIISSIQAAVQPVGGGGGGAPVLAPETHYPPTPEYVPPAAPATPPVYTPPPPPPVQPPPHAVSSGPQPISGPGIFYNPDRKLRYIVQATKGKNYRRYESKLNKGDWGQGGVIPQ